QVRSSLPGELDDGAAVASAIDAMKAKFSALRESIEKGFTVPADSRRATGTKIVADNAALNADITVLLDEQVRRLAALDGVAYRQASYANIAMSLRDIGGLNASLHKSLVAAKRAATDAEKLELSRSNGRTEQLLADLQELRKNPATPANMSTILTLIMRNRRSASLPSSRCATPSTTMRSRAWRPPIRRRAFPSWWRSPA